MTGKKRKSYRYRRFDGKTTKQICEYISKCMKNKYYSSDMVFFTAVRVLFERVVSLRDPGRVVRGTEFFENLFISAVQKFLYELDSSKEFYSKNPMKIMTLAARLIDPAVARYVDRVERVEEVLREMPSLMMLYCEDASDYSVPSGDISKSVEKRVSRVQQICQEYDRICSFYRNVFETFSDKPALLLPCVVFSSLGLSDVPESLAERLDRRERFSLGILTQRLYTAFHGEEHGSYFLSEVNREAQ